MFIHYYSCPEPLGKIAIAEQQGNITSVFFKNDALPQHVEIVETALLHEAANQLAAYFAGALTEFFLPLVPRGTDFQRAVWQCLRKIPYGKTVSYKR